jgi:hypothetical protein
MKALFLLAATSLSALVALPQVSDMTTIKNQVDTLVGSASSQLSKIPHLMQPGQSDPTSQPGQSPQTGDDATDPSATPAPYVAKASPDDIQRSYGQPERVERTVYGETWYYPVYIFYFRNGYVQRTTRSTGTTAHRQFFSLPATTRSGSLSLPSSALATHNQPEPWRFSNHTSLGSASLNGNGWQRSNTFEPHQTYGAATTSTATTGGPSTFHANQSTYHTAQNASTGLGASPAVCNHSTQTVAYHPPVVVQHSAPVVQRSAPVVNVYTH